ncbi:MAG: hypothetical protein V3V33_03460 [Candidatus Lokiarchaeia archaeon]
MKSSKFKNTKLLKDPRNVELERLRLKILDAVRFSKRFWMTYRENTFGIASILNLIYKKSFIEVLFFTNEDVKNKGVPLLKIYTPLIDEFDFNEIIFEPDFDDDGLVSPKKIIERMRKLIIKEFQNHIMILNKEVELLDDRFENYIIDNNPYFREFIISFPFFDIKLKINFEKYPLLPSFSFSKTILKIISEREFNKEDLIKNWNEVNPPHIHQLIEKLCHIAENRLKLDRLKENSQQLILNNISIENGLQNVSFKIHRGKSIGILYDEEQLSDLDHQYDLFYLFWGISGNFSEFSGSIEIFGKEVQLLNKMDLEKIVILPQAHESKILNMKVKKAIKYKINIKEILKSRKIKLQLLLKSAGFAPKIDEIMGDIFVAPSKRIIRRKIYIKNALEVTGLSLKKNKKCSELNHLDFLLFSIARALIKFPSIIMFFIPFEILDRLEYDKFNNYMQKIKKEFHVILIFHAPEGIVSNCDRILTIGKEESKIGTFNKLIEELPQSGEIITIELNNPDEKLIEKLYKFDEIAKIQEERKNEKYKIFLKDDPNKMIIRLTELFGQYLFSFRRYKASLEDYKEFFEKSYKLH